MILTCISNWTRNISYQTERAATKTVSNVSIFVVIAGLISSVIITVQSFYKRNKIWTVPPVQCSSTGTVCINQCNSTDVGTKQWCGACDWYIRCTMGATYYMQCTSPNLYDDARKACYASSSTCTQCFIASTIGTTPSKSARIKLIFFKIFYYQTPAVYFVAAVTCAR